MKDISRFLDARALAPWLVLLLLVPIAMLVLTLTHSGRSSLHLMGNRPGTAAILPGMTLEAAHSGLVVTSVRTQSQAAALGVRVGDAIVAIDGKPMLTLDQARRYLHKDSAATVHIRLVHDRTPRDVRLGLKGASHDSQASGY